MKNRSRIALLIVMLFVLGTVTITAYQSLSKVITLIDDGKVTQYQTDANSVGELLKQLEITLEGKDQITPSVDTTIEDNMKITINRWRPTVNFNLNGETIQFKTQLKTVGDIITAKDLQDANALSVTPSLETAIVDNMNISVKTKEIKTVIEDRPIGFNTIEKTTTELNPGETQVAQEGKNGLKQVTLEKVIFGGELVEETVKEVIIKEEAQDQIIMIGIKNLINDPLTGNNYEYTKVYNMEATAYSNSGGDGRGITASGIRTFVGVVAVDPKVIPLGTRLYVEGYGVALAADTGGAIKGHKIDLFFHTEKECYQFGRRQRTVYVLKDQGMNVASIRK
ncbi:3D domain-containing protein [Cellulosilyticum sp. I15G10I2]|uniref:3D domain-containing protein n=1 Tax=Cellulosilyticum sp. I15G10I2 TaxID=1892843 RepID=UPI00085BCE7F|nr:3D domain-containing protein [Cellulosilyticum sp. I15G10I2]